MTKVFGLQHRQEGYVIEGAGVAWCGKSLHDWRADYSNAIRFARHIDAEQVLHWILPEEYRRTCRVALHIWVPEREAEAT